MRTQLSGCGISRINGSLTPTPISESKTTQWLIVDLSMFPIVTYQSSLLIELYITLSILWCTTDQTYIKSTYSVTRSQTRPAVLLTARSSISGRLGESLGSAVKRFFKRTRQISTTIVESSSRLVEWEAISSVSGALVTSGLKENPSRGSHVFWT